MRSRARIAAVTAVAAAIAASAVLAAQSDKDKHDSKKDPKKPQVTLKVTPSSGMVPVRVMGAVEIKGGDDDFQEFYCPSVEWIWDDGTTSESSNDCDPYETGKTLIRRRYSMSHPYKRPGRYQVSFRLKQKDRIVGSATTVVQLLGAAPF